MEHRQPARGTSTRHAAFEERLWPSPGVWSLVPLVAGLAFVVVLPVGPTAGVVAAVLTTVFLVVVGIRTTPVVRVADGHLTAGRASIPLHHLGAAHGARGEAARQERGPALDPRAYLLIRGWVDPVVRVALHDPQDPTPYWLVSTRRPEALVAALDGQRHP